MIAADEPDQDLALVAAQLAFAHWYSGDLERAADRAAFALDTAEAIASPVALNRALRIRAYLAGSAGHHQEAQALFLHALRLAVEDGLLEEASATHFLLSDRCFARDQYAAALGHLDEALALARRRGDRPREWGTLAERTYAQCMLGHWGEVDAASAEFSAEQVESGTVVLSMLQAGVSVHVHRGQPDRAHELLAMFAAMESSTDRQNRGCFLATRAEFHRFEGRPREALADAEAALEFRDSLGLTHQAVKQALIEGAEAASLLADDVAKERILGLIAEAPAGGRSPYLDAQLVRFRARAGADPAGFAAAIRGFRDLGLPFWLAVTLCEHGELLAAASDPAAAEPPLAEAREIFTSLAAVPWLERVAAAAGVLAAPSTGR
jgi:tetratricopeptide (TPR) repeat protein